jgi:glycolate oxidase iron-sulfur subunit
VSVSDGIGASGAAASGAAASDPAYDAAHAGIDRAALDACVHCGLCLASCPTYVELGTEADSPRGRIQLVRAIADGVVAPTAETTRHLDLCLGCRACETACPSGVPYGRVIESVRPVLESRRPRAARALRRLLARALTSTTLRRALFAPGRLVAGRRALAHVPLVRYAAALRPRRARALPPVVEPDAPLRGTAILLQGCVAETLFHDTNVATARLLARAGVRILAPRDLGCCGALAAHLGAADLARRLAVHVARLVRESHADWIVSNAAGCGAHLRGFAHVLPGDAAAADVAAKSRDALELLADLGLPAAVARLDRRIAVHDPCHLAHGQGIRAAPRALLAAIPGVELVELDESDWCCGSAGTYNLTEPAMSARLLERKLANVVRSGADVVAAANPGCVLQMRAGAIARGLDVAVEHPVDLLAAAHLARQT